MPELNCTVNTCKYYAPNNQCTAQQIIIQSDGAGGFSQNAQLNQLAPTPADSIDATCCQTFKRK